MDDPLRPAREEIFQERGERDPVAVELDARNSDAAQVYMLTRGQVVASGLGIADISLPAVKIAMDLYGVVDQLKCLHKVRKLFYHFMEKKADEGRSLEP